MSKFSRAVYVAIGLIAFFMGTIGVIFPILPTTPFLLLASFCFARGSKRFNDWFIGTKIYKKHLENFVKNKAMTLKQKIAILAFADTMIAIPLIIVDNIAVKVILVLVILCKLYYFIFKIETIKEDRVTN